jgi:multiple antibiotic resistance protein
MTWTEVVGLFLPLFVAVDPLGVLPAFLQMTSGMKDNARRRLVDLSVLTATGVGLLFIPLGPMVLASLGLKTGDFQVAGGILVLVVALRDVVFDKKMFHPGAGHAAGIVPIGIPLLVGPAVFATLILLGARYEWWQIGLALVANLLLSWLVFRQSVALLRWMGQTGSQVISKLAALLLAAYAVMMIRVGIQSFHS